MLSRSIWMQLQVIWKKKIATTIFFLLFSLVILNYFTNIFAYRGLDIIEMYHPMKTLTLSSVNENPYGFYLMQFYPLLVIVPAGFTLFEDKQSKQFSLIQSRVGLRNYLVGKFIAVFLVTFFVYSMPFLLEILLNVIAFPMDAVGDPSNISAYGMAERINSYFLAQFYIKHPYLYSIFFTIIFGIFSGVLAVFTVSISTFKIPFKVLLFLPVYILLYLFASLRFLMSSVGVETNYYFYLRFFEDFQNSSATLFIFMTFLIMIFLFSIFITIFNVKKGSTLKW